MITTGERIAGFTDRLNPMLVRCVRQELSSKMFLGTFNLLLIVAVIACLIAANQAYLNSDNPDTTYGQDLFNVLAWGWSFMLVVIQSGATHRLVMQERQNDTWDLVDLTGIGPRRIVRGLLLANLVQGLLSTAAIAPFLVMAYLLRGLDLVSIAMALVTVPLLGVAASALAVLSACATPAKNIKNAAGGFIHMFLVFPWISLSMGLFTTLRGVSRVPELLASGDLDAWLGVAAALTCWTGFVWTMLVFSEALLTHRAGDRSTRPRLAWSVVWLVGNLWAIGLTVLGIINSGSNQEMPLAVAGCAGVCMALVGGFIASTEDPGLTPRQARTFDLAPAWAKVPLRFLGPGPNRGRWWLLAMGLLSLIPVTASLTLSTNGQQPLIFAWYTLGYGCLLIASGTALCRHLLGGWTVTPLARRLLIILWASLWLVVPVLVGLFVHDSEFAATVLKLLSPVTGILLLVDQHDDDNVHLLLGAVPLIGVLWLAWQARQGEVVSRRVFADDAHARVG